MKIPARPAPALKEKIFRLLYRLSGRKRRIDYLLTPLLKHRHYLPEVAAEAVIPHFAESAVTVHDFPRGAWATPLSDSLTVVKAAIGFRSQKILEIGSYRGTTARLLAENTGASTQIFALDIDPRHGEAYRGTEAEKKITRIVGPCSPDVLKPHAPYDLIFVDADHDFRNVCETSLCAFEVLSPSGVILWHDYQHIDSFVHPNGCVPEALCAISQSMSKNLCAIQGTMLAIYSEFPGWETSKFCSAKNPTSSFSDAWTESTIKAG